MTQARILTLALLATGCAVHRDVARMPVPTPPVATEIEVVATTDDAPTLQEPGGDPYGGASAVPELAGAIASSRAHWAEATAAFRNGDMTSARELFDLAVQDLQNGETALPGAEGIVDALTSEIASFETAWASYRSQQGIENEMGETAEIDSITVVDIPEVATQPEPSVVSKSLALAHDVPIEVNNQVRSMLQAYQSPRLKEELLPAFARSGRFLPMIREIFKEEGVPLDLAWLALVESGFKSTAYSRARARGLWQFMSATGKSYDLDIDHWVDERSDPVKATRAAARHLRDLHNRYDDWYLALAAYNAGAGKVDRAIRAVGRKDYWAIASTRHLRPETKNYVPAFISTLLIVQDPAKYGFDFVPEEPWSFDTVSVECPADLSVLAECSETTLDALMKLNPELRRPLTPGNRTTYDLRLPAGSRDRFLAKWAQVPESGRLRFASHEVKRGETVRRIASRYGVSVDAIVAANDLSGRSRLRAGTSLRIPVSGRSLAAFDEPEVSTHRVRPGETLSKVASRYGTTVSALKGLNDLRTDRIVAGQRLRVAGHAVHRERPAAKSPASARAQARTSGSKGEFYRVRRGESLWMLAARFGVTVADLKRWNGLRSDQVTVGQRLRVSANGSDSSTRGVTTAGASDQRVRHRVRAGETLWAIAQRYGVSVADLSAWNGGQEGSLHVGQRLVVYPGR